MVAAFAHWASMAAVLPLRVSTAAVLPHSSDRSPNSYLSRLKTDHVYISRAASAELVRPLVRD